MTELQREYAKEVGRIKRFIRNAEKRGYRFPAGAFPDTPKRITRKALSALKALTPAVLYEQATYYSYETDRIVSGTEGRFLERSRAAKRGRQTRRSKYPQRTDRTLNVPGQPTSEIADIFDTLNAVIAKVENWSVDYVDFRFGKDDWKRKVMESDHRTLSSILTGAIRAEGKRVVALRLNTMAAQVFEWVMDILYNTSNRQNVASELAYFAELVKGRSIDESERIAIEDYMQEYNYEEEEL